MEYIFDQLKITVKCTSNYIVSFQKGKHLLDNFIVIIIEIYERRINQKSNVLLIVVISRMSIIIDLFIQIILELTITTTTKTTLS